MLVGTTGAEALIGTNRADIILGREGADTLDGGDGAGTAHVVWANDQLFGGTGDDVFLPGYGADLMHGGDRLATATTPDRLNADGDDTADYRSLTASDIEKGVRIQVGGAAPSSAFASNPDIAHAVFVTDTGRNRDTDTLISIETVIATAANDVLRVEAFSGQTVSKHDSAASAHTSGLFRVDLAGERTADVVDFSALTSGATVLLNQSDPYAFATGDDSLRLYVMGAEQILGTAQADVVYGSSGSENLAGGAGDDEIHGGSGVDFIFGGAGADRLFGDDGSDRIVLGTPEGIELSSGSYADGGSGNDLIMFSRAASRHIGDVAATITLADGDAGDRLVWNGHRLAGGTFKVIIDPEPQSDGVWTRLGAAGWVGTLGEVYFWSASSKSLTIYLPDNTEVSMAFDNGDYGLRFAAAPSDAFAASVTRTNNAHDHPSGFPNPLTFYAGIQGREDAYNTPGQVAYPKPATADRPGSQPSSSGATSAALADAPADGTDMVSVAYEMQSLEATSATLMVPHMLATPLTDIDLILA